ncbi:MAG: DUF3500 domain-containing protein [Planctomycetaceae bacterium]|nr:DUF3500 domain-containing protein [Planctomycetaceae bacterium]
MISSRQIRFALSLMAAFAVASASTNVYAEESPANTAPGIAMQEAATRLLESLDYSQKAKIQYSYDSEERLNWHFIPRERNGVSLRELNGATRSAADSLVSSGLSAAGYAKTLQVRSLEEVLYLFEGGEEDYRRERRHPHKYFITIFGTPTSKGIWGWRFEGHHLSLNFSIREGQIVSSTPEFFGANPGLIDAGPGRSLRVLGRREDIAREILKACTSEQHKLMFIDAKAPDDIRGGGVAQPVVTEAVGLRFADMSVEQQGLLKQLIGEYLTAMPATVVRERMKAINDHGMDDITIAWWGGSELNQPHHYVVQGASFIIEYNNTQNEANHVHAIWRNTGGDFNLPASGK